MTALRSMLKVEKILRRIQNASQRKRRPQGGYRPLLSEIRQLLNQTEEALEKSHSREQLTKRKWLPIPCAICLRPLIRIDPKGPLAEQKRQGATFRCRHCDESLTTDARKRRRRTDD